MCTPLPFNFCYNTNISETVQFHVFAMKVICGMLTLYYIQDVIFPLQKPAAVVQFSPKAKNKEPVVGIWRYMTVADVANAIGKSVGKYCNIYFYFV